MNSLLDLVRKLSETPDSPGQEEKVREVIVKELKSHCKEIREGCQVFSP
jgi:putative aminopeptidase FrvX